MPDMGAGITLYTQAVDVATLSLSPLVPNAALVRRVSIGHQSADDIWVIRTNGQEVGRFLVQTSSTFNLLPFESKAQYDNNDIFEYCSKVLGVDLVYPIPEGKTLTISSVGGATADIALEYEEFSPSALTPNLMNYPGGGYFLAPVWAKRAAVVAAPGEALLDTEISLDFTPPIFLRNSFPVGWSARILDLFLMGNGVNTYSGTADHLSQVEYVAASRSGQRLFTRNPTGGIPVIGIPAAAGSANASQGYRVNAAPPLNVKTAADQSNLDAPIIYRPGYVYEWALGITGDTTGNADYSFPYQVAIVEYRST